MLHIILAILKIIGIILAAVLLLLLLALLAVLLVPLRYRITLQKEGDVLYGQGRASYFLHIITVLAEYKEGKPDFQIKIFGIRLGNKKIGKRKKRSKRKSLQKSENEKKASPGLDKIPVEENSPVEGDHGESNPVDEVKSRNTPEALPDQNHGDARSEKANGESGLSKPVRVEKRGGFFHKVKAAWQSILKFIRGIIGFLKNIPDVLRKAADKLFHLKGQLNKYLEILKAAETKMLFGNFRKEVRYLLHHFKPRHAKGYIRFGTGDPASTGQILGIACIFLPVYSSKIQVYPDFDKSIYEGFFVISGHIRICHLLKSGWKLYKDKNTSKFIKRIRQ